MEFATNVMVGASGEGEELSFDIVGETTMLTQGVGRNAEARLDETCAERIGDERMEDELETETEL